MRFLKTTSGESTLLPCCSKDDRVMDGEKVKLLRAKESLATKIEKRVMRGMMIKTMYIPPSGDEHTLLMDNSLLDIK